MGLTTSTTEVEEDVYDGPLGGAAGEFYSVHQRG
jgi:hypothetical protein